MQLKTTTLSEIKLLVYDWFTEYESMSSTFDEQYEIWEQYIKLPSREVLYDELNIIEKRNIFTNLFMSYWYEPAKTEKNEDY